MTTVLTPVKDQGRCGSCYSFAAAALVEAMYAITHESLMLDLSEQQIIDCSRSYGNQGCSGGARDWALGYIRDKGVTTEDQYPYQNQFNTGTFQCRLSTGQYRVQNIIEQSNCEALRSAVRKGPVAVAVHAGKWQFYGNGLLGCRGYPLSPAIDHAVLLVGYTAEGNWIIKNSYGTTWG